MGKFGCKHNSKYLKFKGTENSVDKMTKVLIGNEIAKHMARMHLEGKGARASSSFVAQFDFVRNVSCVIVRS